MRHDKPKILLDSNVWRYVIDNSASGRLLNLTRQNRFELMVAPAVVYEALRLNDEILRSKLIRLMTNRAFSRLMPEAYSEAMELLREIKRLRPQWLRKEPDLSFFFRLEADWRKVSGGFWVRCRRSPEHIANQTNELEAETMFNARKQAENARKEIIEADWKSNPPLDKMSAMFKSPRKGWRGDAFEAWRMDGYAAWTYSLKRKEGAYWDWIEPFIELNYGLLDSPDWLAFWIYDVEESFVPREWLRWAFSFTQRFRKVTPGSPGDSQLSTYFLDSDIVISADRIFIEILDTLRAFAPCDLPKGVLIPGGFNGVQSLFDELAI